MIEGNFAALRNVLAKHGEDLAHGDLTAIHEAVAKLTAAAVQGRACAGQLELEFKKQGLDFFARSVANSLDTINGALAAVGPDKPAVKKAA